MSPEAANGGAIGLVEEGDSIVIDIPGRTIKVDVADSILAARRKAQEARGAKAWHPVARESARSARGCGPTRPLAKSAAFGGVRDTDRLR